MAGRETKVIRSYRLVFRRRWRIFRIGNWRLPLPGGLELRLIGYWLACLAAIAALSRLPLIGLPLGVMPAALRLLAIPLLGAWALCRTELDGRPPHRALLGLAAWRLRPRVIAAGRRVPALWLRDLAAGGARPRPRPPRTRVPARPDRRPGQTPPALSGRGPARAPDPAPAASPRPRTT